MIASKPRILFVDDEPAILAGLQNLLYKDRRRWDLTFAAGGEAALLACAGTEFDVIITDMGMPGMDGAALLTRIKELHPAAARIMLSGHADRTAIVRALPALHLLLSKPCDAATLRFTIEQCVSGVVASAPPSARRAIGQIEKLPSPPAILAELAAALAATTTTAAEVAAIVLRDPALGAKVLHLVNSAYFGSGSQTSSILRAVTLPGVELLKFIGSMTSLFAPSEVVPPGLAVLCTRAVQRAVLARELAGSQAPDDVYAAALLADIGELVMSADATHEDAGCIIGLLWGLPPMILAVIRFHHDPAAAPAEHQAAVALVRAADARLDEECAA